MAPSGEQEGGRWAGPRPRGEGGEEAAMLERCVLLCADLVAKVATRRRGVEGEGAGGEGAGGGAWRMYFLVRLVVGAWSLWRVVDHLFPPHHCACLP